MLSRVNGAVWLEEGGEGEEEEATSWPRLHLDPSGEAKDEMGLPSFKSMLEDDWFAANSSYNQGGFEALPIHPDIRSIGFHSDPSPAPEAVLLPPPVGSSSTCSPSSVFTLDASQPFLTSKTALSSLFSSVCSAPFDAGFDLGCEAPGFFQPLQMSTSPVLMGPAAGHMGCTDLSPGAAQFPGLPPAVDSGPTSGAGASFQQMGFENSPFLNRSKVLRPLEIFPSVGAQPTLFQKRAAAQRQSSMAAGEMGGRLGFLGSDGGEKWRRGSEEDEIDDASVDDSGLNYDSDDATENAKGEESAVDGGGRGNNSNANSAVTGGIGRDRKGKKKGLPAKNLMAERRRRKKLNDRLYMLRSVVPKISKMDRASILGDAIEYLKELLQRINDLHNELESTPSSSLAATNSTSFHPLTPTPSTLPCRVKEELCPSLLPSPNSQPPRVEVQVREGRAVKIHMFCARRPGLLLSTMRALDSLDIDIQQAVISCFNGFALDVFRAEQCKDGPGVLPEEIKAVLLQSAGFHSVM